MARSRKAAPEGVLRAEEGPVVVTLDATLEGRADWVLAAKSFEALRPAVCPRCLGIVPGVPGGTPEDPHPGPFTDSLCAKCEAAGAAERRRSMLSTVTADVLTELEWMASSGVGGHCVLFRRPPEVTPEVMAEIRKLCLKVAGATETVSVPAYCFKRDAKAVVASIIRGLGHS